MSQPPAQVVQRNPVEQHVPGIAVPQRVGPYTLPALGGVAGRVARRTACWTYLQTVTRDTSINLPWPTVPKLAADIGPTVANPLRNYLKTRFDKLTVSGTNLVIRSP